MTSDRTETTGSSTATAGDRTPQWPARAQTLINSIHALCTDWLREPLRVCMSHFDTAMHQELSNVTDSNERKRLLLARQRSADTQRNFDRRFTARIDKAFKQLGQPVAKAAKPQIAVPSRLALLDQVEHDLDGTLEQMEARAETRYGPVLVELGYRFAVLIGSPPISSLGLPIGPYALTTAFREASPAMELSVAHQLLLAQSFESQLIHGMVPLYELVNGHLRAEGILPNLHPFSSPRPLAVPARNAIEITPTASPPPVSLLGQPGGEAPPPAAATAPIAGRSPPSRTSRIATAEDLIEGLASLQRNLAELDAQLRRELRRPQMLQQELVDQLNIDRSFGAQGVDLSPEQSRVIDRVLGVFQDLIPRLADTGHARRVVEELQLPALRVALTDPEFLVRPDHPGRQWLGRMVEAARRWLNGEDEAADLEKELMALVGRASNEAPDAALFEDLTAHLAHQLKALQSTSDDAEQNLVQVMHEQESLQEARLRANQLLARRRRRARAGTPQRELLDKAWLDVLALTLLRHGEKSDLFSVRLIIADQLVGLLPAGDRQKLQQGIEEGLQQIGMVRSQAAAMARQVVPPEDTDAASAAARFTDRLKRRPALAKDENLYGDMDEELDDPASRIPPQHVSLYWHLLELPPRSWFEYADSVGGNRSRCKLVFCSKASGRCLFVNPEGEQAALLELAEVAAAIDEQRLRELPGQADLFETAWAATFKTTPRDGDR